MTKDDFLALLLGAYQGPGSAEEGTFAGDVLRACADGMAQLWSMDVDGLERRAFVSTAAGDWLTRVCADRGVLRLEGESDEDLRARALDRLARRPASGSAGDYREWCEGVEGILRARVLPLARGRGTVDVIVAGDGGGPPSQAALEAAQAAVDRERPIGADARVLPAEAVRVNVTVWVTLLDGASLARVREDFAAAFAAYLRDRALRAGTVSPSQVVGLALGCPGVADVENFTLEVEAPLDERRAAAPGDVRIEEAGT